MPGNRNVIVVGASSGIGEACVMSLDRSGYKLFAGVRNSRDDAKIRAATTDRVMPLMIDVTDHQQIEEAYETLAESVGDNGLQGLVYSAGIAVGGPLEFVPMEAIREQFDVIARTVTRALEVTNPKTRYVTDFDARLQTIGARFIPDRLRDAIIIRMLNAIKVDREN